MYSRLQNNFLHYDSMGTSNRNAACIAAKKVEPYLKGTDSLNSGFVKEFEPLVKWTSDFSYPLFHTEIILSTLLTE